MTEEPQRLPFQAEIRTVRGRDAAESERGLPRTSEITLDVSNGQTLALALPGIDSATTATAVGVTEIMAGRFGACPICLDPDASTVEHVPPRAFGGTAMTWTCGPCNNNLGSRTEAAMQDWFDEACRIRVTVNGVQQPLTNDRALIRKTADGQVIFMLDQIFAEDDDRFAEHMQPGSSGDVRLVAPRRAEYMTGFLKSAYLAACLHLRAAPDAPSATAIREELLVARDARRRRDVVLGPWADSLRVFRTGEPAQGPTLAVLRSREDEQRYLISLAGTIVVDWPFPEITPSRDGVFNNAPKT